MKTDIEIAQSTQMLPIVRVAERLDLGEDQLELYGRYKAKLDTAALRDKPVRFESVIEKDGVARAARML